MEEFLLGVGLLGTAVGVAKDGAEDRKGNGVVEGRTKGDGRGLDRRKV